MPKMAPSTEYTYQSMLPYMFTLIRDKSPGFTGELHENQQKLWFALWELKDQVNNHAQYASAPSGIRQYYLELWLWMKFWDTPFPGVYPTRVGLPQTALLQRNTVASHVTTTPVTPTSYTFSNEKLPGREATAYNRPDQYLVNNKPYDTTSPPEVQLPTQNSIEHNLTVGQRNEIVSKILQHKPEGWVPQHGWDEKTGLPRYAVIATAENAFNEWNGRNTEYFNIVRAGFAPFRIMFQRILGRGPVILYPEAGPLAWELSNGDGSQWKAFRNLWAFLRTWADHGNETGVAENAVQHMVGCRDTWLGYDTSHLSPPPLLTLPPALL